MTKTQNYQLPQWVKSDRIMMDDFNEMCANIEKGLTAAKSKADSAESKADGNSSALESKTKELQAAMDKQKQELQSADQQLRSSISSTDSSLSTLRSTVNGHTGDSSLHRFVKLGSVTATTSGASLSISGASGYAMFLMSADAGGNENFIKVSVNGAPGATLSLATGSLEPMHGVGVLYPTGAGVGGIAWCVKDSGTPSGRGMASEAVSWNSITSLKFSTYSTSAPVTVYGLKA